MGKVKTRETVQKVNDKAAPSLLSQRMKGAFIRSREKENEERRRSPDEYAENELERGVEGIAAAAVAHGKKFLSRDKKNIREVTHGEQFCRSEQSIVPHEVHDVPPQYEAAGRYYMLHPKTAKRDVLQRREREVKGQGCGSCWYDADDTPVSPVERGRELAIDRAKERVREVRRAENGRGSVTFDIEPKPQLEEISRSEITPYTPSSTLSKRQSHLKGATGPVCQPVVKHGRIKTANKGMSLKDNSVKAAKVPVNVRSSVKSTSFDAHTNTFPSQNAKMAAQAAKTAKASQATCSAAQSREAAKRSAAAAKAAAKAVKKAARLIASAGKALASAIAAGGGIVILAAVFICLVGLLMASPFGVFFSAEDSGTGQTMPAVVREINREYDDRLESIKDSVSYDYLEQSGSPADWPEVLAVYAVKVSTDPDDAREIATMDNEKKALLRSVFWDMTVIDWHTETESWTETVEVNGELVEYEETEVTLYIEISHKSAWEMADGYGFDAQQREMLTELLLPEYRPLLLSLCGKTTSLSAAKKASILSHLPDDLSDERREIVLTAYSLLGKVDYFWGGKSYVIGWDERWGKSTKVTSPGSSTTGKYRPYGLDCSGFVDWVFYNASGGEYIPSGGSGGTLAQWSNTAEIPWEGVQPGDLVFYRDVSHVGIVCGFDEDGEVMVIHCASGWNTVVVTGKVGFVYARRGEWG